MELAKNNRTMKQEKEQKNTLTKYFGSPTTKRIKTPNTMLKSTDSASIEISQSTISEILINDSDILDEGVINGDILSDHHSVFEVMQQKANSTIAESMPLMLERDETYNLRDSQLITQETGKDENLDRRLPFFKGKTSFEKSNKKKEENIRKFYFNTHYSCDVETQPFESSLDMSSCINEYESLQNSFASLTEKTIPTNKNYEEKFSFLNPSFDKMKIPHSKSNSDKTSLFIPDVIFERFTPFEKQYWEIKKEYFDVIIFFKKGKFYEMFSHDAFIANREFGLRLAGVKDTEEEPSHNLRGGMPMAGIPESQFDVYASKFLNKGYKVARVEQKETQISKQIREKQGGHKNKNQIIERDIKEVLTVGTLNNYSLIDDYEISNLCSLTVFINSEDIVFVSVLIYNSIRNEITYKSFKDDKSFYKLRTLLIKHSVKEIISDVHIKPYQIVSPRKKERNLLIDENYILLEESYRKYVNGHTKDYEFIYLTKAYKNLFNYLDYLKKKYKNIKINPSSSEAKREFMSLNAIAIENLGLKTDLLKKFNNCETNQGKRLFEFWSLNPLYNIEEIKRRQGVIKSIIGHFTEFKEIKTKLGKLSDLEKLIGKLNGVYKTSDLFKLIKAIALSLNFMEEPFINTINKGEVETRNCRCLSSSRKENNMDENKALSDFLQNFNMKYKISEELIERLEMNENQITLLKQIETQKILFNKYLKAEEKRLGIKLQFSSHGKDPFLLQIEKDDLKKLKNNENFSGYQLCSSTTKIEKFYTPDLKSMVFKYKELLEELNQIENSVLFEAVYFLFSHENIISKIISLNYEVAEIDCFVNITDFYNRNMSIASFPEFVCRDCETNKSCFIEATDLINPLYSEYISNTICLNTTLTILTGPNMAGKSTLLRTIGLNTILAQIGLPVFGKKYKTVLFDKLFIRIGSSDNLLKGESSFKIEMLETANFLNKSTSNSLILVDELGRGTSTKDGESICKATIDFLLEKKPVVIFSTHYFRMVKQVELKYNKREILARILHMKYSIENENIIFLFKLVEGICTDSHGIYLARKAGLPEELINEICEFKKQIMDNEMK